MNEKVAERLNRLRHLAASAKYSPDCISMPDDHMSERKAIVQRLMGLAHAIVERHYSAALDQEIRAAATEDRRVMFHHASHLSVWSNTRAGQLALDAARSEIEAMIAADNAARREEYDSYRRLCMSGVAVPPDEDE